MFSQARLGRATEAGGTLVRVEDTRGAPQSTHLAEFVPRVADHELAVVGEVAAGLLELRRRPWPFAAQAHQHRAIDPTVSEVDAFESVELFEPVVQRYRPLAGTRNSCTS